MSTQEVAQKSLDSIERRILELDPDVQHRVRTNAQAICMFVGNHGNVGVIALNLAAARTAVEVLP